MVGERHRGHVRVGLLLRLEVGVSVQGARRMVVKVGVLGDR